MAGSFITNKCFPPPKQCFNCKRKGHDLIKGKTDSYKRCTGCQLATYCDQDCQREHWLKIHKLHCSIIAGRKRPDTWQHKEDTCLLCIESRRARVREISSIDSPKIACYVENVIRCMKRSVAKKVGYHEEGRTCQCKVQEVELPFQLPFSMGEISGEFLGQGVDEMIAHAIKLVCAIQMKDGRSEVVEQTKILFVGLVISRALRFVDFAIFGRDARTCFSEHGTEGLDGPVNKLRSYLGDNSVWWRALKFSLEACVNISMFHKNVRMVDLSGRGLNDQRFTILRKFYDYNRTQTRNLEITLKNNTFSRFKPFPKMEGERLRLLLPDGAFCQACGENLKGPFYFLEEEEAFPIDSYPVWRPGFRDDGSCLVFCSSMEKNCVEECSFRKIMSSIETSGKKYNQEFNLFLTESRICDFCFKRSLFSHRCTECLASQYCSTQCQKKDLWFHKTVCSKWAKDENRKIDSRRKQRKFWKSFYEKDD